MNLREIANFKSSLAYVRTTGRRTGKPHEVELWFVAKDNALYFLAHKDSKWWKNIAANPAVVVRIGERRFSGRGRLVDELRDQIFEMFREKYGRSQVDLWYGGARGDRKVVKISIQG